MRWTIKTLRIVKQEEEVRNKDKNRPGQADRLSQLPSQSRLKTHAHLPENHVPRHSAVRTFTLGSPG